MLRIANRSSHQTNCWVQATTDQALSISSGVFGDARFVLGPGAGQDTRIIHFKCPLAPGEEKEFDLSVFEPTEFSTATIPSNPVQFFGGYAMVNLLGMNWVEFIPFGAGFRCHLRQRVGRLFVVDLSFVWFPDEPWIAHGEVMITASNPAVSDMTEVSPQITVRFGSALVAVLGKGLDGVVLDQGTTFADGNARIIPISFVWLNKIPNLEVFLQCMAQVSHGVSAVGIEKLLPNGNPIMYPGFNVRAWTQSLWAESQRRLHTFEPALLGPAPISGVTGRQGDQMIVRGEPFVPHGVGSEKLALWAAYKMANRPNNQRENDGGIFVPAWHTQRPVIFWDGRPHAALWNLVERFGKPRGLEQSEANGWWGPDVEHDLMNNLSAAARLTGSHACQWVMENLAKIYPLQRTTTHGWSTSQMYASRALGYECLNVIHFWMNLHNRQLANETKNFFLSRWNIVNRPALQQMLTQYPQGAFMDVRIDDPRLGPGPWYIPWQQGFATYPLDLAGEVFGIPEMREMAMLFARQVLDQAWEKQGSTWVSRANCPISGPLNPADGSFNYFGMSMAVATVLRNDPTNSKAREIYDYLKSHASTDADTQWLVPGI